MGFLKIALQLAVPLMLLYGYKKLTGISPQSVISTVEKGIDLIEEADHSITIVMDSVAQNYQGNEEAIQALEAKGITGQHQYQVYELVRDGKLPDIFGLYSPSTAPASRFISRALALAGNPRWAGLQNWLSQQSDVYMALLNAGESGK